MMHPFRRSLILAALLGLCSTAVLLTACDSGTTPAESDTSGVTETASEMTCKVTLTEADGSAASNLVMQVMEGETTVITKMVDATGVVELTLPSGTYDLVISSPDGSSLYYDKDLARLTPEAAEITLPLWRGPSETTTMQAPSKTSTANYIAHTVPVVGEGSTYITYKQDDHTYVSFNPTRGGVYEFTVGEGAEVTYHGMPIMVYDAPRMSADENGVITIPVESTSIGDASISQLVFRITPAADNTDDGVLFTATRTGDIIKTDAELAEWLVYEADPDVILSLSGFKDPDPCSKWAALTKGTLTDLDLATPGLTVKLGLDGYYHLGDETGPIVFVRITSDSPYIEDFVKMCETDPLRVIYYDEDGNFLRKEGYASLFTAYGEVANADGVVPLNEQLAYVIQNVGRYYGWWNYAVNSDIFGDLVFPESVSWLFACAVYDRTGVSDETTEPTAPAETGTPTESDETSTEPQA